jgi:hypothetical protein
MVKAAEDVLTKGVDPADVVVTCGGFAFAPSGQAFFVSHCENSIYVRDAARLKVSPPPPGIPGGLRPGECVPFTPPAQWATR